MAKKRKSSLRDSDDKPEYGEVTAEESAVEAKRQTSAANKVKTKLPDRHSAAQALASASPAEWFQAQFLAACGDRLSELEKELAVPEQSVSSLPLPSPGRPSPFSDFLREHVRPLMAPLRPSALSGKKAGAASDTDGGQQDKAGGAAAADAGAGREAGAPLVLVVSASATRCVELLRDARVLGAACRTAKLFSKHLKVEEQIRQLAAPVDVAAGTPNRLLKLLSSGSLHFSRLKVVCLDLEPNAKKFDLLTLPDTNISSKCDKLKHSLKRRQFRDRIT